MDWFCSMDPGIPINLPPEAVVPRTAPEYADFCVPASAGLCPPPVPEDLSCSVERAHPFTLRQGIAAALTRSLADETGAVLKTGRQVWTYAGYSDCDYHSTRPAWLAAEGVRLSWERFALP